MVTTDDTAAATALKQQGNKAFASHDWPTAIDFYTRAIDRNGTDPSFFCNRAQAQIKVEAYGYAIADATKALELDKNYIKVRKTSSEPCGLYLTLITGLLETSSRQHSYPQLSRRPP